MAASACSDDAITACHNGEASLPPSSPATPTSPTTTVVAVSPHPNIRSILKKTNTDLEMSGSRREEEMVASSGSTKVKKISFSTDVITFGSKPGSSRPSDMENGNETSADIDGHHQQSKKFMSNLRNKVGGALKRSSKMQVQGADPRGFEASDSVFTFSKSRSRLRRSASDVSDHDMATARKFGSFDTSDLVQDNQSLRAKLARFGRRLRAETKSEGDCSSDEPVLTKFTRHGG